MITDFDVLIAELETAPEGTEELDRSVAKAFGWRMESQERHDVWISPTEIGDFRDPPPFSRGTDAAISLIPYAAGFTLHRFLNLKGQSWVTIHENYPEGTPRPAGTLARPEWTCSARTEALAICAAALKARSPNDDRLNQDDMLGSVGV